MFESTDHYGEADQSSAKINFPEMDLVASLRSVVESAGLDPKNLCAALQADEQGHVTIENRRSVFVSDGEQAVEWPVASLRELFRGNRKPPPDIERYPPAYTPYFYFVESHFLTLCGGRSVPTDQEMEEVYSMLRRRPDAKSVGKSHDFLWQVAALLLGCYVLSEAEFEGIFAALLGSARRWGLKPISRNYAEFLRKNISPVEE